MTPDAELDTMIDRFLPEVATVAREAMMRIGTMFPGAVWLVYDNYNALAIAFGPNEKARAVAGSIALYPRWTSLFLSNGPTLPDPEGLLQGEGGTVRHIRLRSGQIHDPAVIALIEAAATSISLPIDPAGEGYISIKAVSVKQRPRRPS